MAERTTGERAGLRILLALGCLAAFQLLLLRGFTRHVDLNVWDEAYYIGQGKLLVAGRWREVNYAWSLPLTCLHALLERLGVGVARQFDLLSAGCSLAACLSIAWALWPLTGPTAAFLAACWWAASARALQLEHVEANSYMLGLALAATAVGLAARGRPWTALPVFLLAVLGRGEVSLWLLCAGVLWLLPGKDRERRVPRLQGLAYAVAGAAFLAALSHGWRARDRSWLTFRQHFEWGHPAGATVAEVFPGAGSLAQAARVDPGAFAEHLLRNLLDLPHALASLVLDTSSWLPPLRALLVGSACLLATLGLLRRWWRPRRDLRRPAGSGVQTPRFLLASVGVTAVGVLFLPRPALLLPLLPLGLQLLFGWAAAGWRWLAELAPLGVPHLGRAAAGLVLCTLGVAAPFRGPSERPPHRAAVELLRAHAPSHTALLAAQADVLLLYAGVERVRAVNPTALDTGARQERRSLLAMAESEAADLLLDTPLLRQRCGAGQLEELLRECRWKALQRIGAVVLYEREP